MAHRKPPKTAVCLRLDDNTLFQLDEICKCYGINRQAFLTAQIQGTYDKLNGSPLFREMMGTLNSLTEKLKKQALEIQAEQQTNGIA